MPNTGLLRRHQAARWPRSRRSRSPPSPPSTTCCRRARRGGSQKIDVGYLPTTDAPTKPANATVGTNPVHDYTLDPLYAWGINYFPVNYQSTTGNGPIIKQLYFREALAYLMNQQAIISGPLHGYGLYTVGPVGTYPTTQYLSAKGKQGDPFPYNPTKAKQLLTSHGWNVVPNGSHDLRRRRRSAAPASSRARRSPSPCRTRRGPTGSRQEMTQLQSNASTVGIKISLEPKPFNQVTAIAGGNCVVAHISCDWDMAQLGRRLDVRAGLLPHRRDAVPVRLGRQLRRLHQRAERLADQPDADVELDCSPLYTWQDYLATQLPVIWQPNGAYQLTEVTNSLRGVHPAVHHAQHQPGELVLRQVAQRSRRRRRRNGIGCPPAVSDFAAAGGQPRFEPSADLSGLRRHQSRLGRG